MSKVRTRNVSVTSKALGREVTPYLLALLVILVSLFAIHYRLSLGAEMKVLKNHEARILELSSNVIRVKTESFLTEVQHLASVIERVVEEPNNIDQTLASLFLQYSLGHDAFSQLRYLDLDGNEVARINRENGISSIVSGKVLQNKKARYYFNALERLAPDELYISPFDLNVEHGAVETPRNPTIRIGKTVLDANGRRLGWFLVNVKGHQLLQAFTQSTAAASSVPILLNKDGYYISGPNPEDNWNFMFDASRSFARQHEDLWPRIKSQETDQFYSKAGLISYRTIYPFDHTKDYYWTVLSIFPSERLNQIEWSLLTRNLPAYSLILLLGIGATSVIGFYRLRLGQTLLEREYEKTFRSILSDIRLLAVSIDASGKVLFCNTLFLEKLGYETSEVVGHEFSNFMPVCALTPETDQVSQSFQSGHPPKQFRGDLVTSDGNELTIDWSATLTKDSPLKNPRLTFIGKDITDQLAKEEELRTLSRAVEQSASTVMITNADAEIQYVNPKFTQLTGYSANEVKGENPRFLQSGETSREEYEKLWRTVLSGGEWRGEFHNRKKNGDLYWEMTTISAIRNQEGEITHYLAVKEDLTEQKRLEKEAEERKKEVMRNRELAVVGRIANMIAHDLRNPLSSVKMTLQIFGKGECDPLEKDELVAISLDQVRYMENMVADLLSYSRQSDLEPEWLSVDKLLDTAVSITQRAINSSGADVKTHYQAGLPTLYGDRTRLIQVFSNLILNAVQATEKNRDRPPLVIVKAGLLVRSDVTSIQVDIYDNGEGIEPDGIERLFEPFYTTRAKGTGLGLAIVQRILKQHSGEIRLKPSRSGGVHAVVTIPTSSTLDEIRDMAVM